MEAVKQLVVNGPDTYARFDAGWAAKYGQKVTDSNGGPAYFTERFLTTKYYKKLVDLVETFGFVLEVRGAVNLGVESSSKSYVGDVCFSLYGEGKQLKEMLTSLYGNFFQQVTAAKAAGVSIVLHASVDPDDE